MNKLNEGTHRIKKSIQVVSQHGIKGPDTMANLVWANTNISGYVMNNSISIVICGTQALHTGLRVFSPQLASIHWHAIVFFTVEEH